MGEKAKEWIKKDTEYISPSYLRPYPLVVDYAKGMYVWDVDGKQYLDFTAGIAVCATGHCHPEVVRSAEEQAEKLIHMSGTDFYYPSQIKLAEKLAEIVPGAPNRRVFFCNSGAEAVEAAIKLSRWYKRRPYIIAFYGAFHGRTCGALSLTCSKIVHKKFFSPLLPCVIHTHYAYCYRCPFNLKYPECDFACVSFIEDEIFKKLVSPEEVAAVFAEPIQGEGGYIVPPPGFFERLKKLLDKYEILFVDDEVQAGMGRTGRMFGIEHWDVIPDIVCIAKGLASGFPIGAMVARKSIMSWERGAHASTFGGNPISCEAALATIRLLENGLVENAEKMGNYLIEKLKEMQKNYEIMGDVRGKGLMVGVELVKDREKKTPAKEECDKILQKCFEKGLLLLSCGESVIRFMPPLIVEKEHIDKALEIFEEVLKSI